MTAPSRADVSEVEATGRRILRWLRENKYTRARSSSALSKEAKALRRLKEGTVPLILTRAVTRIASTVDMLKTPALLRALEELKLLRAASDSLAPLLEELDDAFPRERAVYSFDGLGFHVRQAVQNLAERLTGLPGFDTPWTRAKWKRFVGETAFALRKAGMSMAEAAELFSTPGNQDRVKAKLLRSSTRQSARRKKTARRSPKKR